MQHGTRPTTFHNRLSVIYTLAGTSRKERHEKMLLYYLKIEPRYYTCKKNCEKQHNVRVTVTQYGRLYVAGNDVAGGGYVSSPSLFSFCLAQLICSLCEENRSMLHARHFYTDFLINERLLMPTVRHNFRQDSNVETRDRGQIYHTTTFQVNHCERARRNMDAKPAPLHGGCGKQFGDWVDAGVGAARAHNQKLAKVVLVVMFKGTTPADLLFYLDYYLLLGVEHVILIDNNCYGNSTDDMTTPVLAR
jgi:hypothetical protein